MKVSLIISLFFNIGLAIFCWQTYKELKDIRIIQKYNEDVVRKETVDKVDRFITSDANFRKVFFEKNDSLYRKFWGEAFENSTADAYLIACGYYQATGNKQAKKDIDKTYKELELYLK